MKNHSQDLKCLKELYRKYKTPQEYDEMFRSNKDGTYSAYVNSLNSSDSTAESKNIEGIEGA